MEASTILKEDMAHYDRNDSPGHPDHTYEWLLGCLDRKIRMQRKRAAEARRNKPVNSKELHNSVRSRTSPMTGSPAMPAIEDSKKGKGKGKRDKKPKGDGDAKSGNNGAATRATGGGNSPDAATPKKKRPCWHHNNAHHNGGPACRFGDKCHFAHDQFVSRAEFGKMPVPQVREPSQSAPSTPRGRKKKDGDAPRSRSSSKGVQEPSLSIAMSFTRRANALNLIVNSRIATSPQRK